MHTRKFSERRLTGLILGILVALASGLAWSSARAQTLDDLQWITEEFAPYNYTEDGVPTGISVDILLKIWERLDVQRTAADIQVLPWARGYRMAQDQPGTCLFSTVVTDARRELFVFVEPVVESNISIIAPKARALKIDSVEALAPYRVGVVREAIGDQALLEDGFSGTIVRADSARTLMRMFHGERFDVASYNFVTAHWTMRQEDIDSSLYEPVFTLREGHMGYACHKDTDPALIARLQGALDALIEDGTVERITHRYLQ